MLDRSGWPGILVHSGGFLGASTGARTQPDQVSQITTKALGAWGPVPVLSKASVDSTHLHSWIYHFIHYRFTISYTTDSCDGLSVAVTST